MQLRPDPQCTETNSTKFLDEPRRSGRATKGQHTKNLEGPTKLVPKSKSKSKTKKQQEEEEEEEEEETVRCLCGAEEDEEDEGRNFTCCDNCNVWQHNDCMGLPLKYEPKEYFCEQCKPEDHPRIVEALQQGEKPDAVAAQMRESVHSKKKGRKSKGARTSEIKEEPAPATPIPEPAKRKHTGDSGNTQVSLLTLNTLSRPLTRTAHQSSKGIYAKGRASWTSKADT